VQKGGGRREGGGREGREGGVTVNYVSYQRQNNLTFTGILHLPCTQHLGEFLHLLREDKHMIYTAAYP